MKKLLKNPFPIPDGNRPLTDNHIVAEAFVVDFYSISA